MSLESERDCPQRMIEVVSLGHNRDSAQDQSRFEKLPSLLKEVSLLAAILYPSSAWIAFI
jgi:hypothetical protein